MEETASKRHNIASIKGWRKCMDEASVTNIMECIEEPGLADWNYTCLIGTTLVIATRAEWELAMGLSRVALIPLDAQDECVICYESSVLFPVLECCSRTNEDCLSVKRICHPCRTKVIKGTKIKIVGPWQHWKGIGQPRCPLCRRNLVTHSKHKQFIRQTHKGGMWVAPIGDRYEWVTETGSIFTAVSNFTAVSKKDTEGMREVLGCELIDHPAWKRLRIH